MHYQRRSGSGDPVVQGRKGTRPSEPQLRRASGGRRSRDPRPPVPGLRPLQVPRFERRKDKVQRHGVTDPERQRL